MSTLHELVVNLAGGHRLNGAWTSGEDGQGLAEYALILTFVALVVVSSLTVMGSTISGPINTVAGKF